jgi:aspartyl-tRNA(Asn)/glutamyl-tRNA(Gln) amidotransferase subunit C
MAVSFDEVRHIAALARLGVPEDRLPVLAKELSGILAHMDVLQSVSIPGDTADDAAAGMPLRADGSAQYPLASPRESFAPAMRDGFFLVPRLATHEDEAE